MTGWSVAYVLMALLFLNTLIILVSIVLAPYHAWRLLRAVSQRLSQIALRRRLRGRPRHRSSEDTALTAS